MLLVSVVITTKNEERNIGNCLESVLAQTYKNVELIVVDNFSTDKTLEIAQRYTEKAYSKGPERSAQRNFGMIEKASGEYVMYVDADMLLAPTLIEECVNHMQHTGALALHISEVVLGKRYFSRVRRFERGFYDGTPIDGARFFQRSVFEEVGGFDEVLFEKGSGEDWDLDKKIKLRGWIALLPNLATKPYSREWQFSSFVEERGVSFNSGFVGIYHNESEFELLPYLRKKSYYTQGFDGYIKKWGSNDPDIRCQFGLLYRYWVIFTENGKWKALLKSPLLALGMYFLRVLVGTVYLYSQVTGKLGVRGNRY